MSVELVYGADFWCNRRCKATPPSLAETRPKIDSSGTSRTPDYTLKLSKLKGPVAPSAEACGRCPTASARRVAAPRYPAARSVRFGPRG